MKILQINSCNFGSTGTIMRGISAVASEVGHESYMCIPASKSNFNLQDENQIFIGNRISRNLHLVLARLTGKNGCYSYFSTKKFLKKVAEIKPDVIHLHNLHNCYINLELLFKFIKKHNIPVVWTLHDCWSFTGQCPYFTMAKCDKWKTGCYNCPTYREYPGSCVDRTKTMWRLKRKWFSGVENMTVVTPSAWLSQLVKQSYLGNYPIKVINNGINLSVFKPRESDFRRKYKLEDKYVVLGVAFGWGARKGLDVFLELAGRLDDRYRIVLVGADDQINSQLPENIISIPRTANQSELAEIYAAADVFANPTREDNYPTVNMEALASGTPVVTFKTGGSPEIIDPHCGAAVECDNIDALEEKIKAVCEDSIFSMEACLNRAVGFDMNEKFTEYIELYNAVCRK